MSLSLRSRLLVFIGPERLSVYKLGRGFTPRLLASHSQALDPPQPGAEWQALGQKLAKVFAAPELRAAEADVVLSNKLVRHALAPYNALLKKPGEREMFARHVLGKTYGSAAAKWELRLSHQRGLSQWIVSAVDRALVEEIERAFAGSGIKLRSVHSRLTLAYNYHRDSFPADPAWLVIREAGYSLFARLDAGRVVGMSSARHEALEELPKLLDRENLLSGLNEWCRTVYLVAAEDEGAMGLKGGEYQITVLDPIPLGKLASGGMWLAPWRRSAPPGLQLDFHRPVETASRRAGWMLLTAGVFMTAEMGFSYAQLTHQRAALTGEMAAAHISLDGRDDVKFSEADSDAAQKVVSRLRTPWEELFAGLESISNKRVAVLAVTPDMQTGILGISGVARDNAALLTLLAQLRRTRPFSEVYLSSQETKSDDPQRLLRFAVRMRWKGQP